MWWLYLKQRIMFWFYPLIVIATAVFAGGIVAVVIYHCITHKDIKNKINELNIEGAIKYRVKQAKKHSVNVGIFNEEDEQLDEVEFTSEEGVSKSVANAGNKTYLLC